MLFQVMNQKCEVVVLARRGVPQFSGIYMRETVQGVDVDVTVDLADGVLLGMDILQRDEGPADLVLSENKMMLRGQAFPLYEVATSRRCHVRKVRASDHQALKWLFCLREPGG